MHELTVAAQIRSMLEAEFEAEVDEVSVTSVRVQVGALTGIVPEALQFAWPHAMADSQLLESARLEIDWVEAGIECGPCATTRTTPSLLSLRCPVCRSGEVRIVGGDELDIVSVDIAERVAGTS